MDDLVDDHVVTDVDRLDGNLSPRDALSRLPAGRIGIVFNAEGRPAALATQADLMTAIEREAPTILHPAAQLGHIVAIERSTPMTDLESAQFRDAYDVTNHTLVVLDHGEAVGILPEPEIEPFIRGDEVESLPTIDAADSRFLQAEVAFASGLPVPIHVPLLIITCRAFVSPGTLSPCLFANPFAVMPKRLPNCRNPHLATHQIQK